MPAEAPATSTSSNARHRDPPSRCGLLVLTIRPTLMPEEQFRAIKLYEYVAAPEAVCGDVVTVHATRALGL